MNERCSESDGRLPVNRSARLTEPVTSRPCGVEQSTGMSVERFAESSPRQVPGAQTFDWSRSTMRPLKGTGLPSWPSNWSPHSRLRAPVLVPSASPAHRTLMVNRLFGS
jgi:hypothetical protein